MILHRIYTYDFEPAGKIQILGDDLVMADGEHTREELFIQSINQLFKERVDTHVIYRHLAPFIDRLIDHSARDEALSENI